MQVADPTSTIAGIRIPLIRVLFADSSSYVQLLCPFLGRPKKNSA